MYWYHLIQVSSEARCSMMQLDISGHNISWNCLPTNLGQWMYRNTKHCALDSPYTGASRMPMAWNSGARRGAQRITQDETRELDRIRSIRISASVDHGHLPQILKLMIMAKFQSSTSMNFQSLNSFLSGKVHRMGEDIVVKIWESNLRQVQVQHVLCKVFAFLCDVQNYILSCSVCI